MPPPFWETDVVTLGERERREANYYEGLRPLWPKLGQLMVRADAMRRVGTDQDAWGGWGGGVEGDSRVDARAWVGADGWSRRGARR